MSISVTTLLSLYVSGKRRVDMHYEDKVDISVYGKHYTLTREMVIDAAERLKKNGYSVRPHSKYHALVGNVRFTISSLLAESLGIMQVEASGQQAFRALTNLGFTVVDASRERRRREEEARKEKKGGCST